MYILYSFTYKLDIYKLKCRFGICYFELHIRRYFSVKKSKAKESQVMPCYHNCTCRRNSKQRRLSRSGPGLVCLNFTNNVDQRQTNKSLQMGFFLPILAFGSRLLCGAMILSQIGPNLLLLLSSSSSLSFGKNRMVVAANN